MGTSVNQGSPRSGPSAVNWASVAAGYVQESVTIDRLVREVWRAAQRLEGHNWKVLLKSDGVALCFAASAVADTPEQAVSSASRAIIRNRQSSVATEVAKRALVQGYLAGENRPRAFAGALFGEVTNYLVSRDLPGYVGQQFRNRTVHEAVEFKDRLRSEVRRRAAGAIQERGVPETGDRSGWNDLVDWVVESLSS